MISKSLRGILTTAAWISMFALGALPGAAVADDQPAAQRTLTLRGEGLASATPDFAWLRIGVDTQAPQARDALIANAGAMSKVVTALKSDGVTDKDVQTSALSVAPLYSDDPKKPRIVTGYRAGNVVTARIRNLQQTGAIIDQVVALGSNDIAALRFDIADSSAIENEARKAAIRDAVAKAKLYASTAGVELGPIMKIVEQPAGNSAPAAREFTAAAAGASTPVESGVLTFEASVEMTWSIK